jgi:hypothetical protein
MGDEWNINISNDQEAPIQFGKMHITINVYKGKYIGYSIAEEETFKTTKARFMADLLQAVSGVQTGKVRDMTLRLKTGINGEPELIHCIPTTEAVQSSRR